MLRTASPRILCLALALVMAASPICVAQQAKSAAPIPTQIFTAKKVFISNLIGGTFSYGIGRPYDQFYTVMKNWGRYELVGAPADAELIFEISSSFYTSASGGSVGDSVVIVNSSSSTEIRLVIMDQKTHVALWSFNQWISPKFSRRHPEELDHSIDKILESVKKLATSTPAPANVSGK